MRMRHTSGFTLIELSIVLIIIGLIVGGILTGQDLINTAAVRAQISQVERYQTAVRTFQAKYGWLPGDIPDPYASRFGFQSRGSFPGEGDGNGILQANASNTSTGSYSYYQGCGELAVFWEDLSGANLIDAGIAGFDTMGANYPYTQGCPAININLTSTPPLTRWLPAARIGNSNYVYVWSIFGKNYFGLSTVTQIGTGGHTVESSLNPGLTVQQAYMIDSKADDGKPMSGNVTACYVNYTVAGNEAIYASGGAVKGVNSGLTTDSSPGWTIGYNRCNPTTAATPPAITDCYGNNNTAGTMTYSVSQNAGVQNCALSFGFQ